MINYRGKYRVCFELDKRTGNPCELSFIPCTIYKGSNIYRHSDTILGFYISSITIGNRLLNEYPTLFTQFLQSSSETMLLFPESKIEEASKILKPYVKGRNISPRSRTRNKRFG
jgi:hypothetical protein